MPPKPADFEKAVKVLLTRPHVDFVKQLRQKLEEDPRFLYYHETSVGLQIQRYLFNEGIRWEPEVMITYWSRVLRVALERLGGS